MIEISLMAWVLIGGLLEPLWVVGLKYYDTTKKPQWLILAIVFMFASPMCIGFATDGGMQIGIAYSVWTGLGAIFAMVAGFLLFKERVDRLKILFVILIIVGIVGIRLTSGVA